VVERAESRATESRGAAVSTAAATAVVEIDSPRLVFFYDKLQGRSRRADGFLAQVLQRGANHRTFVIHRVEVGERPDLAKQFRIDVTPTLLVITDKKVRGRLESPTGCRDIELLLRPWLRSPHPNDEEPATNVFPADSG
jgi:thioredoxin-like negative regulator of GroEL